MADIKPAQISAEDKELNALLQKVQRYPKLARWVSLFFDKTNKETFGNRTKSALIAYSLDPITQYHIGGQIGYENYKKLENLAMMYYEQDGLTVDKVLDLIASKAMNTNNAIYAKLLAEIMQIYNPKTTPQIAIQNNIQVNNDISLVEEESLDKQFHDFIVSKAKAQSATLHPDTSNSSGV